MLYMYKVFSAIVKWIFKRTSIWTHDSLKRGFATLSTKWVRQKYRVYAKKKKLGSQDFASENPLLKSIIRLDNEKYEK